MDLLAQRYASPFSLLDKMISQKRFFEFVREVNTIKNEEKLWEIWLHRVFDKPYDEWKESLTVDVEETAKYNADATVKNSLDILNGFNPETGEVANGII